jgi:hypothetical protein
MLKKNFKKILTLFTLLLIGALFSLFGNLSTRQNTEVVMTWRDSLVSSFVAELPEINKKLPYSIDASTTLLSIEYLNGKVVSRYRLVNVSDNEHMIKIFVSRIQLALKMQTCSDDTKRKLLDVDVEFVEKYQNFKGEEAFEVVVNKSDCL